MKFRGRVRARDARVRARCWPVGEYRAMWTGYSRSSSISLSSFSTDHSPRAASVAFSVATTCALTAPTAFASGATASTFTSPADFSRRAPFAARARVARGMSLMYRSPDAGIRYGSIDVAADVNVRAYLVCEDAGGTRYRKIRNAKVLRDLKYDNQPHFSESHYGLFVIKQQSYVNQSQKGWHPEPPNPLVRTNPSDTPRRLPQHLVDPEAGAPQPHVEWSGLACDL